MAKLTSHRDLDVYRMAFRVAMQIFELSKSFPDIEKYSMTDQIRRSSRSVCANIAEAFRKKKYPKAFISKIVDAEAEAAETQNWLDFAIVCKYLNKEDHENLYKAYENIIGKLVNMRTNADQWS